MVPRLPEAPTRRLIAGLCTRWPQLWGLDEQGKRVTVGRCAFERAFPAGDAGKFLPSWIAARGEGLATSLVFLARWLVGRRSGFIQPAPGQRLPGKGPVVVAALHYSIDPAVQLSCIYSGLRRDFLWAIAPLQETVEDDRDLWFKDAAIPPEVERMLMPVRDRAWIVRAAAHLRRGGGVFLAIDAPYDSARPAPTSIRVGHSAFSLAPSVELFLRLGHVPLFFAAPRRVRGERWTVELVPVADVEELAAVAERWIAANQTDWAGWQFMLWRDDSEEMRREVAAGGGGAG